MWRFFRPRFSSPECVFGPLMNEVTCLFLSVTKSDPPRSWRSGINKVVTLRILDNCCLSRAKAVGKSAGCQQECAVRIGVTGKTRRIVYPCRRAGVNTLRKCLMTKRTAPEVGMKPGEVIGVHGASICSYFCARLCGPALHTAMPLSHRPHGLQARP